MEQNNNEKWGSRWGFLLATAGSAIGLGNIWKFPYVTGVNGGAAFVCVYLLAILIVGMPLMIAELSLGRATGCHPAWAFDRFTGGKSTPAMTTFGTLMILCGAGLAVNLYHITMTNTDTLSFNTGEVLYVGKRVGRSIRSAWSDFWLNGEESL